MRVAVSESANSNRRTKASGSPRGWRKWLYRFAAMTLVPGVFLFLLESGLWLLGYGYPTSYFVRRHGAGRNEFFTDNPDFGRRFFPTSLVRKPPPLALRAAKPAGTCRLFILGESAAMGYPDPSMSFGRMLELMLRERFPQQQFEVVNTAMIAINSHAVLPIAQDCARFAPDFFIVYLGNNEVVGAFGAAGVLNTYAPSLPLVRASLTAKSFRTGQLLGNLMQRMAPSTEPAAWDGMAMFATSQVAATDPRLATTCHNFRQNLADICRAGVNGGATVLVCTVPSNLRDCPPFASLHAEDLAADRAAAWDRAYADGLRLETAANWAEALAHYAAAAAIDDQYAELHFREARCRDGLKQWDRALSHYRRARDLDGLRFRADTHLNDAIREVAGAMPDTAVGLVDAEAHFAADSPGGVPGDNLFFEHVHMNFKGNYRLAAAVFHAIARKLAAEGDGAAVLSERACAERLAYGDWAQFKAEATIRAMRHDPPFTGRFDHAEVTRRWDARVGDFLSHYDRTRVEADLALYQAAIAAAPEDWMLRASFAEFLGAINMPQMAIEHLRIVCAAMPYNCKSRTDLGYLSLGVGDVDAAQSCFAAVLRIDPEFTAAHYGSAKVRAARGEVAAAVAQFEARVAQEPDRCAALAELAKFLIDLDHLADARAHLRAALAINPDAADPHLVLGYLLVREGAVEQAVTQFEAAARARPREALMIGKLIADARAHAAPAGRAPAK